jgi:excisionase family DNA binding protein
MSAPAAERVESAQPVYLTPAQVAELLQVNERTVLRWAQQDASMPVTRIGRVVRFERGLLLRWLARKAQGRRMITSPAA